MNLRESFELNSILFESAVFLIGMHFTAYVIYHGALHNYTNIEFSSAAAITISFKIFVTRKSGKRIVFRCRARAEVFVKMLHNTHCETRTTPVR